LTRKVDESEVSTEKRTAFLFVICAEDPDHGFIEELAGTRLLDGERTVLHLEDKSRIGDPDVCNVPETVLNKCDLREPVRRVRRCQGRMPSLERHGSQD